MRTKIHNSLILITVFELIACDSLGLAPDAQSEPVSASAPADGLRWDRAATLRPQGPRDVDGTYLLYDDMLLDIAAAVPGFAGFFVNEEERAAYVWLRGGDATRLPAVERELQRYFGGTLDLANGLRVLDADYSFPELKALQLRTAAEVMAWEDVVYTDVDEVNNRVTVGVATPAARERVLVHARRIGASDALEVELADPVENTYLLTDSIRAVGGGLQTGHPGGSCSLGFVAVREGVLGFLTASHCTPQQWGYDGSAVQQNDAGGVIGVELADPSHWTGTVNGFTCPAGRLCRESDAAFFSLTADASPGVNRPIAWPNALFTTTFEGYGYVRSQGSPAPGSIVQKIGHVSGRSKGNVDMTCAAVNVKDSPFTHTCAHRAPYTSIPGDSGGSVYRNVNGAQYNPDLQIFGVNWGSDGTFGYFSSMGAIKANLGPLSASQ